jgi:hypothetical protein
MMKFLIACFGLCLALVGARLSLQSGFSFQHGLSLQTGMSLQNGLAAPSERALSNLIAGSVLVGSGAILLALVAALGRLDALNRHVQALAALAKSTLTQAGHGRSDTPSLHAELKSSVQHDKAMQDFMLDELKAGGANSPDVRSGSHPNMPSGLQYPSPSHNQSKGKGQKAPKIAVAKSSRTKQEPWERQEPIMPMLRPQSQLAFPQAAHSSAQTAPRMASVVAGPWPAAAESYQPDELNGAYAQDNYGTQENDLGQDSDLGQASYVSPASEGRMIIRRYDSDGIAYQLFSDGSIDAQTEKGHFRFSGLNELRAFIEKRSTLLAS